MLFMMHIQEISIKQMNNNNFIVEKNFNLIITKFNNSRETRRHMEKMGHLAILVCSNMLSSYIQSFLCRCGYHSCPPYSSLWNQSNIRNSDSPHIQARAHCLRILIMVPNWTTRISCKAAPNLLGPVTILLYFNYYACILLYSIILTR